MNCKDSFFNIVGSTAFQTYTEFEKALHNFQRLTKSSFKITSSTYFPTDTVEREVLIYRYIRFVCCMHKDPSLKNKHNIEGSLCSAHFTVGSRGDHLKVIKFDMLHNHNLVEQEMLPDHYFELTDYESDPTVDCTSTFLRVFTSMLFSSFEDLQAKVDSFQNETGSLYTKRNAKKFPNDSPQAANLVYKSFAYECYHYGTHFSDSKKRNRRSAKIGCRSKIYVSCAKNMLNIVRFDVRHNHDVTPERALCYSRNRRLTASQLSLVEDMLHTTKENHALKEYIETTFNTSVTLSDVRNIKLKLKNTIPETPLPLNEDAILSQLSPILEQLQIILSSTTNRTRFYNRLECLGNLIELWKEENEAVIVPQDTLGQDAVGFPEIHDQPNSQHNDEDDYGHRQRDEFDHRLHPTNRSRRNHRSMSIHEQCIIFREPSILDQMKHEDVFDASW